MAAHLPQLIKELNTLPNDIKAESVVVDMLRNGVISNQQYIVNHQGQFSRAYRYDILEANIIDYHYDSLQMVSIDLSRDSLYDMLPQSYTHAPHEHVFDKGAEAMIDEYKKQKQEQKSARSFFSPFENEFFRFRVDTEMFEQELFHEIAHRLDSRLFYNFWKLSDELPSELVSKFIRFLPYTHRVVGDINLATSILSIILDETVEIEEHEFALYEDKEESVSLGNFTLGVDSIIGSLYQDYSKHLRLNIGPLKNTDFRNYLQGQALESFVSLFCQYFYPLEVEVQIKIKLAEHQKEFNLSNEQFPVLGYNTYL
uniref:type VI secretion system baseplate subunit TssG n=1 Tax=Ornithobacterium rhinotracheale TaxID=28251 RepID=UPI0039A704AA